VAVAALMAGCTNPGGGGTTPTTALGGGGGYIKGGDPNALTIGNNGSFGVGMTMVGGGQGFGGGTIYSPNDAGTYAGIVLAPGFLAARSSVDWYGPLLASNGFVVMTIDTNSVTDFPDSRATQLVAAMKYLTNSSAVKAKVDANRLALGGWSMGGGGTLLAGQTNPQLKALFPMAEWGVGGTVGNIRIPTLVTSCQGDSVASNDGMSTPAYNSLAGPKVYNEVIGSNHFCVTGRITQIAKAIVSFAKLFMDGDTRYKQFISPGLSGGGSAVYKTANF
jgi:hypothetical protein